MLRFCNFATKGENWDGTDFKMGVGTSLFKYSEWTLNIKSNVIYYRHMAVRTLV